MKKIINSPSFAWFRKAFLKKILKTIIKGKTGFCCLVTSWHSWFICWKDLKEVQENLHSEHIALRIKVGHRFNCNEVWFDEPSDRILFLQECLMKFKEKNKGEL